MCPGWVRVPLYPAAERLTPAAMKLISPDLSTGTAGWFPRSEQAAAPEFQGSCGPKKDTSHKCCSVLCSQSWQLLREQSRGCRGRQQQLRCFYLFMTQPKCRLELITFPSLDQRHCPKALNSYMVTKQTNRTQRHLGCDC